MRRGLLAIFFAFNLFACINVMLPVLWSISNRVALMLSAGLAVLASGAAVTVAVQALLNVSVCLNLMPAKGLPLPLVSAGGSDVLLTMLLVGLLLNVAKEGGFGPVATVEVRR